MSERAEIEVLAGRLRTEGAKMIGYLGALEPGSWEQLVYSDSPDQLWTVRQIVYHLVFSEQGFHRLIGDILAGGDGAPAEMAIDDYNARKVAELGDRSPVELILELTAARKANVVLVSRMTDADLAKSGRHPFLGESPLEKQVKLIYRHAMLHIRDIKRILG